MTSRRAPEPCAGTCADDCPVVLRAFQSLHTERNETTDDPAAESPNGPPPTLERINLERLCRKSGKRVDEPNRDQ